MFRVGPRDRPLRRRTIFKALPFNFSPLSEVHFHTDAVSCCETPDAGFGFSGRINFLTGTPEDIAATLNCVYSLLQKLQHEQFLKEDAQAEHKRLRVEAQTYEQNLSRLRKEIEIKERDIATLKIRVPFHCRARVRDRDVM